jgi:predicted ABC-type transport system involved in lysophospholipase L1 biosynthesis ATPase subunit
VSDPRAPLVELHGVRKHYGAARPLHVTRLAVSTGDRLVLSGLDASAAEMFVLLVTGAALPDEGDVRVAGRPTSAIATDVEWLTSLDRFGLVTNRAVLIDKLSAAANMALPLTLAIDPMSNETRAQVAALADAAGLSLDRLDAAAGALSPLERMRVHLARALAQHPALLLLEHPTALLEGTDDADALGQALRAVAETRRIGWIALSDDARFARASGGTRLQLMQETGDLRKAGGFWDRFR